MGRKKGELCVHLQSVVKLMASKNNSMQPSIPHFNSHYDHWSMLMENFLWSKEYWQVIENGVVTPVDGAVLTNAQKKFDTLKLKDLKAKN